MSNAISKQNVPDEASESTECNKIDYNFIQWYRSPFSNRRPTKLIRAENVKLNWKNQDNPPSGIVRIAGQSTHCCGSKEAPTLNPTCDIIYNNKVLLVRKSNKNVLPLANVWHKRTSIAACSILRSSSSANVPKDWPSLMARPANINERQQRRWRRRPTGDDNSKQEVEYEFSECALMIFQGNCDWRSRHRLQGEYGNNAQPWMNYFQLRRGLVFARQSFPPKRNGFIYSPASSNHGMAGWDDENWTKWVRRCTYFGMLTKSQLLLSSCIDVQGAWDTHTYVAPFS